MLSNPSVSSLRQRTLGHSCSPTPCPLLYTMRMVVLPSVLGDDVHKLFGRRNNTCRHSIKIPFSQTWEDTNLMTKWVLETLRAPEVKTQLFSAKDQESKGRRRWRWMLQVRANGQAMGWVLHKAGHLILALHISRSLKFREVTYLRSQKQPWGGVRLAVSLRPTSFPLPANLLEACVIVSPATCVSHLSFSLSTFSASLSLGFSMCGSLPVYSCIWHSLRY